MHTLTHTHTQRKGRLSALNLNPYRGLIAKRMRIKFLAGREYSRHSVLVSNNASAAFEFERNSVFSNIRIYSKEGENEFFLFISATFASFCQK